MLAVSKGHSQYTHPTAGIAGEYVGSCVVNNCGPFTYTDDGGAGGNYSNNINSIYRVFVQPLPEVACKLHLIHLM